MKYICELCGWVYDEEETGVKFEDLPADFACELCGAGKDSFSPAIKRYRSEISLRYVIA